VTSREGAGRAGARRGDVIAGYLHVAPSLVGVTLFLLVPIVVVIWLSFEHWNLLGTASFTGLANWRAVFADGRFVRSLGITLLFVVVSLPLQVVLGLVLGLCLERRLPGTGVFRVILMLPWVCAPLTLGVVWKWIFTPDGGVLNALTGHRVEWLSNPALVLPSIIAVYLWSGVGYTSLFFSAGLSSIPQTVLEAARLDGAGAWATLLRVRLPLIRPTFFFVIVTGLISSFQLFDLAYALAPNGGPQGAADLVAGRIYYEAFQSLDFGKAAVMALVLFAVIAAATLAQQLYFRRRTVYEID
jgi:multiple sugar transport system permease protein